MLKKLITMKKGNYKVRVGHSTADHMMYIQVRV